MLTPETLPLVQQALAEAGLDGWLLYDFRGTNAIASGLLGLEGMTTRRVFAWVPRVGAPTAIGHAIEPDAWVRWPASWGRETYSAWRTLEATLATFVRGRRIAMEYSPGDAVPYLDRIPAGVLDMVRAAGADVVSSADLVSRFYAVWTPEQLAAHQRIAERVAGIAHEAFRRAGAAVRGGETLHEHELQAWIADAFVRAGYERPDHGPIVAVGANAASPHYEPSAARPVPITDGQVLLIDLWAREPGVPHADQTWMAMLGPPGPRELEVWAAIRDARDAAIALLSERIAAGTPVRGAEADAAARGVIEARGLGPYFTHRTGHSIDARELHGAGPHLDDLETRDERTLLPGVGFSIEPGVYLPHAFGMRTEVNAYVADGALIVTPATPQRELLVL